jgi:hypothetical protein
MACIGSSSALEVSFLEPRVRVAPVARDQIAAAVEGAGEEAAAQWTIGD